jgi:hypothetical protein
MIELKTSNVSPALTRILPRVEEVLKPEIKKDRQGWRQFSSRLHRNLPTCSPDMQMCTVSATISFFYLEDLIVSIARLWFRRKFNGIEEEHADIMNK